MRGDREINSVTIRLYSPQEIGDLWGLMGQNDSEALFFSPSGRVWLNEPQTPISDAQPERDSRTTVGCLHQEPDDAHGPINRVRISAEPGWAGWHHGDVGATGEMTNEQE